MQDAYFRTRRRQKAKAVVIPLYGEKNRASAESSSDDAAQARRSTEKAPLSASEVIKKRKVAKLKRRVLAALAAFILLFAWLNSSYAKKAASAAEKEAERIAEGLINSAILETLEEFEKEGLLNDITEQHVNGEGVGFLYIDAAKINLISSKIIENAQKKLEHLASTRIDLPIGTVSGMALLNGVGPKLKARIQPVGSIVREFSSSFTAAGVNQTKYSAEAEFCMSLLVQFGGGEEIVTVKCKAPLVETVIVGGVPHAYTDVGSFEDALNLIPTDAE